MRKGVIDHNGDVIPLPKQITSGLKDVGQREGWNRQAHPTFALPTETWREHVARRERCLEIREKLAAGEIHQINDLITYNLDIRQFVQDAITTCEGPDLLRAFFTTLAGRIPEKSNEHIVPGISVLDPTCGSGAFLFAALNILEPLYEACLTRMRAFVDDMDNSGEPHSPQKYADFRRILADVERHPNARYFILKSIVVNNLYGVDIMEEAVEICKLRLFLKLVAQVDKVKELEPLPDIDFNIRAGNTLVGFASLDEVKRTLDQTLGFDKDQVSEIVEDAETVELSFERFHEMQTVLGTDAQKFTAAKSELRTRLNGLAERLDDYLANDYGVNKSNKIARDQWNHTHEPFHWFAEFYGIMNKGGFDAIIGNPPYVEYRKVQEQYTIRGYSTQPCGNLFAYTWERCLRLCNKSGRIGMIIPVASVCTEGYSVLQELLRKSGTSVVTNFNDRPSKLFDGLEHIRLSIILHAKSGEWKLTYCSNYNKWQALERCHLFQTLKLIENTALNLVGSFAKVGSELEASIIRKVNRDRRDLASYVLPNNSKFEIHYTRKLSHFVQILDFVPTIKDAKGRTREPSELKMLSFPSSIERDIFLAVLNSTMFYWLLTVYSDCRNLNKREVGSVQFDIARADPATTKNLCRLSRELMLDIKKNARTLTMNYKKLGLLQIECTYPKISNGIIDKIDEQLASHYGFSKDELNFIINYDIKYRLGEEDGQDEE